MPAIFKPVVRKAIDHRPGQTAAKAELDLPRENFAFGLFTLAQAVDTEFTEHQRFCIGDHLQTAQVIFERARVMQINIETKKIDILRFEEFCGRIIAKCAKAGRVDLFHRFDQFINEIADRRRAAPAHNIGRNFIHHADREHRGMPGAGFGGGTHCGDWIGAALRRIEKTKIFIPGHIHQHAQLVFQGEIQEPDRRSVIDANDVPAEFIQQSKIAHRLLDRGEEFSLRVRSERPVGNAFDVEFFAIQSKELSIEFNARFAVGWRWHLLLVGRSGARRAALRALHRAELSATNAVCQMRSMREIMSSRGVWRESGIVLSPDKSSAKVAAMQISLLVQMLREKIEPKLIYSPFLRLIIFSVWFQLGFAAVMLTLISAALYLPKIWRVSPHGFEPIVRVSGLDMTQNWALKRSAQKLQNSGDFRKAAEAWQGAISENPADRQALRGFLSNALNLSPHETRFNGNILGDVQWLLRLDQTNTADLELLARICNRRNWFDIATYFFAPLQKTMTLPPGAQAMMIKSLFHQGRIAEFAREMEQKRGQLQDPELPLYRTAYQAGWGETNSDNAFAELQKAAENSEGGVRAGHLLLEAAAQKQKIELYSHELERLAARNEANAADQAGYWALLAAAGRTNEAVKLVQSTSVSPETAQELLRVAQTEVTLGLTDSAAELMKGLARQFGHAPEVWLAYGKILEMREDWDEMRAVGRLIRQDGGLREMAWGLGYFLEGRADLAQKREASADTAFEQAAESSYDVETIGASVARELMRLNRPQLALKIQRAIASKFETNLNFWNDEFNAAYAAQDQVALLEAAEHAYKIIPKDPLALNRYAAALLLNRVRPDEAIQLTFELYVRYPQNSAAIINHSCALLLNKRAEEARKLLESLNVKALSSAEINPYYLALFETYHTLGQWDRARKVRAQITEGALFPKQREWLQEREKEMPKQLAKSS